MGDMEPQLFIFCKQSRLSIEGLGQQDSQKYMLDNDLCLETVLGKGFTDLLGAAH